MSIAIFHEHPQWNASLFAELSRRGVAYESIDGADDEFHPGKIGDWDLLVNRMSPSAWSRGHLQSMLQTPEFLHNVERAGIPVISGAHAYEYEFSKRKQLELFFAARARYARAR